MRSSVVFLLGESLMTVEQLIEDVIAREGGYVAHPADTGGPTKFGVTRATLSRWRGHHVTAAAVQALASGYDAHMAVVGLVQETSRENPVFRTALGEILTPRHPSQLYEALVEGLILFLILLAIRVRWKNAYHGVITGIFFILYAIGRIAVENFREPDSEMIAGMTKGQFYSIFMMFVGIAFLAHGFVKKRRNRPPA